MEVRQSDNYIPMFLRTVRGGNPRDCGMPNSAVGECVCSGQGRLPGGGGV